jgi:hypothetical protein
VDKLGKRLIIIPVQDTIIAYKLAPLFLLHVVRQDSKDYYIRLGPLIYIRLLKQVLQAY